MLGVGHKDIKWPKFESYLLALDDVLDVRLGQVMHHFAPVPSSVICTSLAQCFKTTHAIGGSVVTNCGHKIFSSSSPLSNIVKLSFSALL